ncbi:MAG TPA: right-handed parallel beta-helix repeat-containing protein [Bryobacteraceae bacterium]|nr:right-handed parallel beta-helix repeat-containing protein [Bryobacteraceae bacterium]HPT26149.1 right-handed parallel beta-helix repeat-containing protein [Bryobacteraceae bacterium]
MRAMLIWLALAPALVIGAPKVRKVGPGQKYQTPCKAVLAASDGDTIEIDAKGEYAGDVCAIVRSRLTLRGVNGRPKMDAAGKAAEGKAIWVIKGSDTEVENVEFTGAAVGAKNGAGIRQEGRNLTVRNCYFHHNENGILTTHMAGDIRIEHSEFGWNGHGDGYSHNIYVGGTASFTLHASYMHHSAGGNLVKSRAAVNTITYNRLSSENGKSSWELDLPNGGQAVVLGNVIQQGAESVNEHMISFGSEGPQAGSRMLFSHNTVVNLRPNGKVFLQTMGAAIEVRNNLFAGKLDINLGDAALPKGNVLDPGMRFAGAETYDYALAAGSPAIDAAGQGGTWRDKPVAAAWQYAHPACVQARTAVGTADAGAYEYGLAAGARVCAAAPAVPNKP